MNDYTKAAIKLKKHKHFTSYEVEFLAKWIEDDHKLSYKRNSIEQTVQAIIHYAETFMMELENKK